MASVRHLPEMAIGNALGSILCNTGFIAGMMLVLRPIYLSGKAVANVVSGTVFLGLSFAVYVAGGVMGQGLSRTTGGMLLVICILFLAYNVRNAYSQQQEEKEMHAQEQAFGISDIIRLVLEAVVIYIGASMLVEVGPKLARAFGVPEMIISLTFVALGTSLPELVTSLMALRKKHASLSMGNIIGADILNFVKKYDDFEKGTKEGKLNIVTGMEGLSQIGEDIDMINYFYDEVGVRHAMLTWNELNALATGWPVDVTRGLTEAGKKAVKRIQDLGMVMDVSHLNDKCFWGVIDLAQGPIIASHSNARSVCPAMRNLTDDMLKAIAKTGGLVGMNSMREFISEKHDEQNVEHLADHVEYIADLIGIDHIGLGFDFDDYLGGEALKTFSDHVDSPSGDGISNEAEAKNILAVLKKRGYSQEDLDKIGYKNFYRVFKEVWK